MPDTKLEQIETGLNKEITASVAVGGGIGGLQFKGMGEVMEFAKLMSLSSKAVPPHLRGDPGACLAVSVQALGWRMDPFAVANKSYFVNDRIAFEAQLIHAVIEQRAPIKGRIQGEYFGKDDQRKLRVWADLKSGGVVEYMSPELGKARKKSPLWKDDPDQQLWYYSVRAMCRRHFPDVILGVYSDDEINDIKDITPRQTYTERLAATTNGQGAKPMPEPQGDVKDVNQATAPLETAQASVLGDPDDEQSADVMSDEYTQGENCFKDEIPVADCPFEVDTQEGTNWLGGWYGAKIAAAGVAE
ncbi:MAG: recombinase RecT [Rhodobacteraceae bacterium]|nr:recombinase RecT [Paracoccaceae bacterium]